MALDAVEEEAEALGQEAQVGGLAVEEQVEDELVQLRRAHPVLLLPTVRNSNGPRKACGSARARRSMWLGAAGALGAAGGRLARRPTWRSQRP